MNIILIIKIVAVILATLVILLFVQHGLKIKEDKDNQFKIGITSLLANFGDTFGVGSFASFVALKKYFNIMPDETKFIGSLNIQAMITSLIQALIFLKFINVDLTTLLVSTFMIALGGISSGIIAVNLSPKIIRKFMLYAFLVSGILLLLAQLNIIKINGVNNGIYGYELFLFAICMFLTGILPAFGVGYYVLVQIFIFIFHANPLIAFPIMTTASAFQMPTTSIPFILKQKFYFKSSIICIIFGILGVLIATPLITNANTNILRWLLIMIISYNVLKLIKDKNN
jgi:uncharacterized membrane protein YfcA